MIGEKFGNYEIIDDLGLIKCGKKRRRFYLCKCGCGNITKLQISDIKRANKCKSCSNRQYVGQISGHYFSSIRYSALSRGIEFNITKQYAWNKFLEQDGKCTYTKRQMIFGKNSKESRNVRTASLDRRDNSKGYIEGNVHWIYQEINFMKGKMGEERFLDTCDLISEQRKKNKEQIANCGVLYES